MLFVFFLIFLMYEYKASRIHVYVLIFLISLVAPHNVLTSLKLYAECGQNKTLKQLEHIFDLSDVFVESSLTFVDPS